jgi:Phage integrase family
MPRYQIGSIRKEERAEGPTWVLRYYATRSDGKRVERTIAIGLTDIGPAVDRQKLRETINQLQPFQGRTKNIRPALSGLHRERTQNRPVRICASEGSHDRNLRATSDQSDHSPLGETRAIRGGVQRCRGAVSGIAQRKRAEKGEAPSRSYDRQDSPHHELGLQARSATQLCAATARRQSDELGKPTDDQRLQGAHHDAQTGVRGSSQHSGAEANAHPERRGHGLAGVGIARIDVDGSRLRRIGDVRSQGLCVGKVQGSKVESFEGAGSHASAIGGIHARLARKDALSQRQRLRVSERKARGQKGLSASIMVQKYLRPAAVKAGVIATDWKGRFGFHNFRHSLATAMVKLRVDPKTVQGILRHEDFGTTMDLYAQSDMEAMRDAQGKFLEQLMGDKIHLLTGRVQ